MLHSALRRRLVAAGTSGRLEELAADLAIQRNVMRSVVTLATRVPGKVRHLHSQTTKPDPTDIGYTQSHLSILDCAESPANVLAAGGKDINMWDAVIPVSKHKRFRNGMRGSELQRLMHRLQRVCHGQIASSEVAVGRWIDTLPKVPAGMKRLQRIESAIDNNVKRLDTHSRLQRELVLTHIKVLDVRSEIARNKHTGSKSGQYRRRSLHWRGSGELRDTRVALIAKAFHANCPGLLLNLLLDWNTGETLVSEYFLDRICAQFLDTPERIEESFIASRLMYDYILGDQNAAAKTAALQGRRKGTSTRFKDTLWQMDNIDCAIVALDNLAKVEQRTGEDMMISSLAVKLMDCCQAFNQIPKAKRVFHRHIELLKRNPAAYNILLIPEANAYNMSEVVSLLRLMKHNGAIPDPATWTAIIYGMFRNGRAFQAMKLFSLHLEFLPRKASVDGGGDNSGGASGEMFMSESNIWQDWYAQPSSRYEIPSFITNWIRALANEYHESRSADRVVRRGKRTDITPWLPTLATHKLMLKSLGKHGTTAALTKYVQHLKSVWPQYSQYADWNMQLGESKGIRAIERIMHSHLAQRMPEIRSVYGLYPVVDTDNTATAGYYAHVDEIMDLAKRRPSNIDGGKSTVSKVPERAIFNKSLNAYATEGDMRTILHHMRRFPMLNDIASWTEVVRCVCTQIVGDPGNELLLYPQLLGDNGKDLSWIAVLFRLAKELSARGIDFNNVTFGVIVQTAMCLNDFKAVGQTIDFMAHNSTTRFNVDMLKMVIGGSSTPFEVKQSLVKSMLGIDRHQPGSSKSGGISFGVSTIKPDRRLLSLLVASVRTAWDMRLLRDLADTFESEYDIKMASSDYAKLLTVCRENQLDLAARVWIDRMVASHTPISGKLAELLAVLRL